MFPRGAGVKEFEPAFEAESLFGVLDALPPIGSYPTSRSPPLLVLGAAVEPIDPDRSGSGPYCFSNLVITSLA